MQLVIIADSHDLLFHLAVLRKDISAILAKALYEQQVGCCAGAQLPGPMINSSL
jgi:hypothetical protein